MTKAKGKEVCALKARKKDSLSDKVLRGCLDNICEKLDIAKENSINNRVPYGEAQRLIDEMKKNFPILNKNMVNYHLRKRESAATTTSDANEEPDLPGLYYHTDDEDSDDEDSDNGTVITTSPISIVNNSLGEKLLSPQQQLNASSTIGGATSPSVATSSISADSIFRRDCIATDLGGRPKGTTIAAARDCAKRLELAKEDAARQLKEENDKVRKKNEIRRFANPRSKHKRVKKGVLDKIIAEVKITFLLPIETEINIETVRGRAKRNRCSGKRGHTSPMKEIEPYLVQLCQQLADMRAPISVGQGLALANSLLKGSEAVDDIQKWKQHNNAAFRISGRTELGPSYWRGFMRRNGHLIETKKAVKFDGNRSDWCTYGNFDVMYEAVYEKMAETGIAGKLPEAVFRNIQNEVVLTEAEAFGLKTPFNLIRPDKLLFVDEVGSNTSQKNDGAAGGVRYIGRTGKKIQEKVSIKDTHFTVMGFTSANGLPVMCAVIFQGTEYNPAWQLGLDPMALWEGHQVDVERNTGGDGKRYPKGPECEVNGKKVPCFCCCSESGGITGELLTKMLKYMDDLEVFDRSDRVDPFLLLDGHGSRFEIEFLEYINSLEHKWTVCVGVPYGTAIWQVGDSSEQNGCFKIAIGKEKTILVNLKNDINLPFAIEKTDVVGLVLRAWKHSFARVRTNIKAAQARGWANPLSKVTLLLPELHATKPRNEEHLATESPESNGLLVASALHPNQLNLTTGFAGTCINRIVAFVNHLDATTGVNQFDVNRKRKATAIENINAGKRLTAGLLVAAGEFELGTCALQAVRKKAQQKDEIENEKRRKIYVEYISQEAAVMAIMNQNKTPDLWNLKDLKTMVKWYKRDGDSALPTTKQTLLTRFHETYTRPPLAAPIQPISALPPPIAPSPAIHLLSRLPPPLNSTDATVTSDKLASPPLIILDYSATRSSNNPPGNVSTDNILDGDEDSLVPERRCCAGDYCIHGNMVDCSYYCNECGLFCHFECGRVNERYICDACWRLSL